MGLYPKQIEHNTDKMIENEDSVSIFEDSESMTNEMKYGKQLMRKYYVSTLKHHEVPKPQFANILKNVLYVSEERITDGMAESLKVFVQNVDKDKNPSNVVRKLCLSDNGLTDEAFAKILEGFVIQNKQASRNTMQLHSLVYSNNELGAKSLEQISLLAEDIYEIALD